MLHDGDGVGNRLDGEELAKEGETGETEDEGDGVDGGTMRNAETCVGDEVAEEILVTRRGEWLLGSGREKFLDGR